LSGCTLIPKYHRPPAPISSNWPINPPQSENPLASDIGWREFFSDPRLQKLIELGLQNNRDLRIAALNVEQLRAQYRIFTSALLPTLEGQASNVRQHEALSTGSYSTTSKYFVGLNTSYEVDLFGRIRSLKAEALEQYLATEQARKSTQIALVSQIALQYLNERAVNEELVLSQETLKAVQTYYGVIKGSYDLGNTSALDLHSAEAQMQTARVNIAAYRRELDQAKNALVFLIGEPLPDDLPAAPQTLAEQKLLTELAPGLPSDLLERRPDILQAEHELKGANANIGAARAAFFPQITLTAQGGSASYQLSKLLGPASGVWNFSPQINIPIFNEDTNLAQLDVARINELIATTKYEKVIQNAFREVSDALVAIGALDDQVAAQKALVEAQTNRYHLADQRYRNGVDSYLAVLTAQQDLYQAQQNDIRLQLLRLSNLVSFYQVLGGGWQEHTLKKLSSRP
jgi:multidrug efflux system outer membrane protein